MTPTSLLLYLAVFILAGQLDQKIGHVGCALGVNYGTMADNLPQPKMVAEVLKLTVINKVKLFQPDKDILRAFSNTGIEIILGIQDELIPNFTEPRAAKEWLTTNVLPHFPAIRISAIAVGNEVVDTHDFRFISNIIPAMESLHAALVSFGLESDIKVSTPHSLGVLETSSPPSKGSFRPWLIDDFFKPMLNFLARTGAPFMANVYPFFSILNSENGETLLDYALFKSNSGYTDPVTYLHYTNMFDALLDAVYSAMRALGHKNILIMVTETGWPSGGDPGQALASMENAETYNRNLIKHIMCRQGTPLQQGRTIDTYLFGLFNENQKQGPSSERNYGLFGSDMSFVYPITIFKIPKIPLATLPPMAKSYCNPRFSHANENKSTRIGEQMMHLKDQECELPRTLAFKPSCMINSCKRHMEIRLWIFATSLILLLI